MNISKPPQSLTAEDATKLLIDLLRNVDHGMYGSYGYDLYLSTALLVRFEKSYGLHQSMAQPYLRPLMPPLYNAAWELCRRGILRPGVNAYNAQATDSGGSGEGYSITPFGRQWLSEGDKDDFVPTEPERFGQMLAAYKERFGAAYHQRAQEAVRCYGAHAYLACSAMCGAAFEAVIVAAATKKADEETVLKEYESTGGRRSVEKRLFGQSRADLKGEFNGGAALLKYWRDSAAHGRATTITDNEAYTSLALLLRFAFAVNESWDLLTDPANAT